MLEGKTAVISGAASPRGIGFATARLFAEHGAKVAILDLNEQGAKDAAVVPRAGSCRHRLRRGRSRVRASAPPTRPSRPSGRSTSFSTMPASRSRVKTMEIDEASWRRIIDVNLTGVLYLSQAFIPHMRSRRAGLDRLHVVGLGPARRRHLRRPALLGREGRRAGPRQGHGAGARARTTSGSIASRPA